MKKIAWLFFALALALFLLAAALLLRNPVQPQNPDIPSFSAADVQTYPEENAAENRAEEILSAMSTEEKVWQMLMVYPEQLIGCSWSIDPELWSEAMTNMPAGGIFFASPNMPSELELKKMLDIINSQPETGAFLALDEEGGSVARLSYTLGVTTDFLPMYEYRDMGTETARENAQTIARDIGSFGFNVNFAPVADVWTNPRNTVIGKRAYSDDPAQAAELVAAAVEGLSGEGIIATLKHFPGHGDTVQDSHVELAINGKALKELENCEFLPFASGIEAGAGMVMVGHVLLKEIDPFMPATLSPIVIEDILRARLGFEGVVITDAFAMEALCNFDNTQAALMAIEAGCDIILCPNDPHAVVEIILKNIPEERINESVLRILELKLQYGIIE